MIAKWSTMFMRRAAALALIAVFLFGAAGQVSAAGMVRYAKVGGLTSGTCNTWTTACTLSRAWGLAVSGDSIWVAKGTYKPTVATVPANPRTKTFTLKKGVNVYGGFAGTETLLGQRKPSVNVTILSGELGAAGKADNAYHVVTASGATNAAVLDGFTITAGNANGAASATNQGGGMVNNFASPVLQNMVFSGNSAKYGGAIYNYTSSAQLSNVAFKGNLATYGAGMYNYQGSLKLTNVTFSANSASGAADSTGGGIYNHTSSPVLTNVIFSSNTATHYGGGMYNYHSSPKLAKVTFDGNSASATDGAGGGMYNDSGGPTLTDVTFSKNTGGNNGGGMYSIQSSLTLTRVAFRNNSAAYGGGMYNVYSSATLSHAMFSNNKADWGGGMINDGSSPALTDVTFSGNTTNLYGRGGGMLNQNQSSPPLTNVTFSANKADRVGGGMYNDNYSSPALTNVTFSGNTAGWDGGGIYNYNNSSPKLTNGTFSSNTAGAFGGGMFNATSSPMLTNVTFSGNSATYGGAIYNGSGSNPSISNSIFWGDATQEISNDTSTPIIKDSIVQGGCTASIGTCTNVLNANPKLGPLQNNGGLTKTHALLAGSAAIDAGGVNAACAVKDQRGYPRPQDGNGDSKSLCDMGAYELLPTAKSVSIAAQDGWVLESGETTNVGGTLDAGSATFAVGDNAARKQYRGVLSFNTSGLPDNAVITSAQLTLTRQSILPAGTNPFNILQGLMIDVRKGFFGAGPALELADFQATGVRVTGPFKPTPAGAVYKISLPSGAYPYINKLATDNGLTQLRLRFALDDNNDAVANFISFCSGNHVTAANRPTLLIEYYMP